MKTINAKLLVLFLFVSSVTYAQVDYNDYDANRDGGIDQTEFNEGYQNGMSDWDADGDDYISDREFYDANFNRFDRDRDNNLTQDEWNEGYNSIYSAYLSTNDYDTYDADRDKNISNDEFYNTMRSTDYYSNFDANRDNKVDRTELGEGVFNEADQNQDGILDENEYNGFNSSYNIDDEGRQ
ncbi:hypothetical protein LZ575_07720 [Antarcticibacterium sp. 1MA-6-2]|uniref:hypothetical protein n=1 Tax=Antarcticibacterium sp. 1MA-6-2 TaxID=2908210 RepID=UPI001F46C7AD|nr:hypothetical protein [Antarcticibacterium sp. 1MA-6-2]UJH92398.1 hypothetical protein LZ575_07720 [Antarcticibacterium sp. 1MA-6-2]